MNGLKAAILPSFIRVCIQPASSSLIIRDDDDMTIDGDKGRVEINLAAISTDSRELRAFPRGQT